MNIFSRKIIVQEVNGMQFGGFDTFTLIDYPGKIACAVYTIGCNFRCPYCHNPELVNETVEERFSEGDVLSHLEKRRGIMEGLVITGGEPTMHKELPEFMARVKKLGYLVKLDSNGTAPEMLEKIIEQGVVDYIAMDIKAPLEKYAATVLHPVHINAIRESIALIQSSPIEYEFRTTVVKSLLSPRDIEDIAREIKGAKRYYLQKFISSKILNPQFKRKVTYTDEEFEELRNIASAYVESSAVR